LPSRPPAEKRARRRKLITSRSRATISVDPAAVVARNESRSTALHLTDGRAGAGDSAGVARGGAGGGAAVVSPAAGGSGDCCYESENSSDEEFHSWFGESAGVLRSLVLLEWMCE
jgi:hypothetical protein